jgi:hypothetical protein
MTTKQNSKSAVKGKIKFRSMKKLIADGTTAFANFEKAKIASDTSLAGINGFVAEVKAQGFQLGTASWEYGPKKANQKRGRGPIIGIKSPQEVAQLLGVDKLSGNALFTAEFYYSQVTKLVKTGAYTVLSASKIMPRMAEAINKGKPFKMDWNSARDKKQASNRASSKGIKPFTLHLNPTADTPTLLAYIAKKSAEWVKQAGLTDEHTPCLEVVQSISDVTHTSEKKSKEVNAKIDKLNKIIAK